MSNLLPRFQQAIARLGITPQSRVLLALSGGLDSTVLFHLLKAARIPFAVAHVNYGLRGADSDADQAFCENLARQNGVACHTYAARPEMERGQGPKSVQETAREIRYRFFGELCAGHGFTHVATAHHANDSAETFFINLLRVTGIKGLGGIPGHNGRLVRPLLGFTQEELVIYAGQNFFDFRKDTSNDTDNYLRNRIRHHVLPALEEAQDGALQRLARSMAFLERESALLDVLLAGHFPESLERTSLEALKAFPRELWATVLFKRYRPIHLSYGQAEDLAAACGGHAGKLFPTPSHRLLLDRGFILLETAAPAADAPVWINENGPLPGYRVSLVSSAAFGFTTDPRCAFLDADRLQFPLLWRMAQPGDTMQPLGMKGRKKISDILTDAKVDRFGKEKTHVLCSGNEIVWLEGMRIADSSKILPQTARILCIIPENW